MVTGVRSDGQPGALEWQRGGAGAGAGVTVTGSETTFFPRPYNYWRANYHCPPYLPWTTLIDYLHWLYAHPQVSTIQAHTPTLTLFSFTLTHIPTYTHSHAPMLKHSLLRPHTCCHSDYSDYCYHSLLLRWLLWLLLPFVFILLPATFYPFSIIVIIIIVGIYPATSYFTLVYIPTCTYCTYLNYPSAPAHWIYGTGTDLYITALLCFSSFFPLVFYMFFFLSIGKFHVKAIMLRMFFTLKCMPNI